MTVGSCPLCGIEIIGATGGIDDDRCPRCRLLNGTESELGRRLRSTPSTGRWVGAGRLTIRVSREPGDHCLIQFFGELDLVGAALVSQEIDRALEGEAETFKLDLSGLEFVDVAGLRALRASCERWRREKQVVIERGNGIADRIIPLAGLETESS